MPLVTTVAAAQPQQAKTLAIIRYSLSIMCSNRSRQLQLILLLSIFLTACERPRPISPTIPAQYSNADLLPTPTLRTNIVKEVTAVPPPNSEPIATRDNSILDRLIPCNNRTSSDDLTIYIDKQYYISANYIPSDLVNIANFAPAHLIWGNHMLRYETAVALGEMIDAMIEQDLQPIILSAYRDYEMQAASYAKWQREQPARADIISARPGSSEHQLGTTVDFGSPELVQLVGPNIQFHQQFAHTSEGKWLATNAHLYGFTLSYPQGSFEITGYEYEPWHFRYIGIENATNLYEANTLLLAWQAENLPPPCVP